MVKVCVVVRLPIVWIVYPDDRFITTRCSDEGVIMPVKVFTLFRINHMTEDRAIIKSAYCWVRFDEVDDFNCWAGESAPDIETTALFSVETVDEIGDIGQVSNDYYNDYYSDRYADGFVKTV